MMESVSTLCLIELALDLCSEWKKLVYVLGLEYRDADRIFQDYRKNGVAEQAYRMLREWQAKNGSKATYEVLGNALRGAPVVRVDLAEKYCDGGFRDTSNEDWGDCSERVKCGKVSHKELRQIAHDFGKDWMWVGRLLGLDDSLLDGIKEANDDQHECSYKMLLQWMQRNSSQATYCWLAQVLLHRAVGKRLIFEKYCVRNQLQQQNASRVHPEEQFLSLSERMGQLHLSSPREEPCTDSLVL